MDKMTREGRSRQMSLVRGTGNKSTELFLVQVFRENHISGWRRKQAVYGRPDFVFLRHRIVVFVDGDFWHGHPRKGRMPKSNTDFWITKIAQNRVRDRKVIRILKSQGWKVLRIWESELGGPQMKRKLLILTDWLKSEPILR